ncbi:MAG: zinc-ribbon domain containing protein [Chloroflexota bacterium]|nr:zinc-ribbon domain containing protein [Chloroflexota bacterium]
MQTQQEDRVLHCRDCDTDFIWTAGEQAFYASKGLENIPGRCPACRAQARATRQTGGMQGARPREYFPAVCDRCGVQTQVPFLPRNDRPVYCSSCFDVVRLSQGVATAT